MIYIQRKGDGYLETVDEFEDRDYKEARRVLDEYRLSDPYGHYYRSSRACKEWRESKA